MVSRDTEIGEPRGGGALVSQSEAERRRTPATPQPGPKSRPVVPIAGARRGSYVVRDNNTGDVIQISNKNDPHWVPDQTIKNP